MRGGGECWFHCFFTTLEEAFKLSPWWHRPSPNTNQIADTVFMQHVFSIGLPRWLSGKESACNADLASIPGSGRCPGGGNGTYSSILDWWISWTEEPGGQQSTGSQRVGHDSVCTHTHLCYCPLIYFISSFKRCWRGPTKTKLITWKMCSGKWGACLPWMMELSYVSAWILSLRGNEGEERAFATLGFTPTSQGSFWVFLTNEQITPKASSQSPFLALFPDVCCTGQRAGE